MHELGIVYHIIRDVENVARANGVSRVSSVTLLLGEVSGVVPDLLLDAWRWAADKKPITEGAELVVEPVEAVTHCEALLTPPMPSTPPTPSTSPNLVVGRS